MTDITQGPGFEMPQYADLVNQYSGLDQEKLEKVSQILAEAQMTHAVLMNFSGYKKAVDTLSKSVFDPIQNKLVQTKEAIESKIGGGFSGGDSNIPAELLQGVKNPSQLNALLKTKLAEGKGLLKSKINDLENTSKSALEDLKQGNIPTDINFTGKEELLQQARGLASKTNISNKILNDFEDVVNQKVGLIPDDIKSNLLEMGIKPQAIKDAVSGKAGALDIDSLSKQYMSKAKFDDAFTPDQLDISADDLGKLYRARTYLDKLKMPGEETGMLRGDSTIARLSKEAMLKAQGEANTELDGILSKIKLTAKQQVGELGELDEEFPLPKLSATMPSIQDFSQEAMANTLKQTVLSKIPDVDISQGTNAFKSLMSGEMSTDVDTDTLVDGLNTAKKVMGKIGVDTEALDEFGIGDLISAGLGIASLVTGVIGLFEKPKKETPIVQGEQLGV